MVIVIEKIFYAIDKIFSMAEKILSDTMTMVVMTEKIF